MATTLDLLNKVLVGLRKSRIPEGTTAISDEYHLLLLQFINIAKNEVEGAWDWHQLRDTISAVILTGENEISLSADGDADTDVPGNARLLYARFDMHGSLSESTMRYADSLPQVYDTTDGTPSRRLQQVGREQIHAMHEQTDDLGDPAYFALRPSDDDTKLRVYPAVAGDRTIQARFVIPQPDLADDDLTTVLKVPASSVWLRALFYANQERGEELGRPGSTLDRQANEALGLAISGERTELDDTGLPQ